jgi:hypothetical protein
MINSTGRISYADSTLRLRAWHHDHRVNDHRGECCRGLAVINQSRERTGGQLEARDQSSKDRPGASRIKMDVAADGSPSIALADKQDHPRVRLTLTKEGFGAIEFLDAKGKIIDTLAPEARKNNH